MRPVCFVLMLAACGRFGFEQGTSGDDDVATDAPLALTPSICDARPSGALTLVGGETPTKVRATRLSSGFAVAIETDANNVYVARTDDSGTLVSIHTPMQNGYTLHGISQVGDRPFVYVFTSGAGYIKMLVPDWNSYDTGPSGEQLTMDPQQALLPGNASAVYGVIGGGFLSISTIDTNGASAGSADYAPPASFASFAPTASGVRVVVENTGSCETFTISPSGATGTRHTFAPCYGPLIATIGDATSTVLHRTAPTGPLALHDVPAIATDPGTTTMLEIGSNPRIAAFGGAIWAAYLRGAGDVHLLRVDGNGTTMQDFPGIGAAFDLLPDGAFWIESGGMLRTGSPCLQ